MNKRHFENITLVCVDCKNYGQAIFAIQQSTREASFKAVKFITDIPIGVEGIEVVQIPKIKSTDEYSKFIIYELYKYFDTEFVWVIQYDGYILDISQWTDEFLQYDGIGAKWLYVDGRNNFNGGCSLRSKKLQTILGTDPFIEIYHHEDDAIGRIYRRYLEEKHGIKFPPDELCDRFAYELNEPICKTVGFHGNFHPPYRPIVVLRRSGAFGDVIQLEPLCRYFYSKGYRVFLDTPVHFWNVFRTHYFPIEHFSQIDKRHTYTEYCLDMAYEVKPKQLHIDSYFEFCGITDAFDKTPKLNFPILPKERIIAKKYVVIHIDRRAEASRNVYGINWQNIVLFLRENGYEVIQIGLNEHESTGAIEMRTINENQLMYVIAGCEFFIGIDSAPSHIASALGKRCIIFFGSVPPTAIHPNFDNIIVIHNHEGDGCCERKFCWADTIGTTGTPCYLDVAIPPCVTFSNTKLINALTKFI